MLSYLMVRALIWILDYILIIVQTRQSEKVIQIHKQMLEAQQSKKLKKYNEKQCVICFEEQLKHEVRLYCGHNFCSKCFFGMQAQQKHYKCAICNRKVEYIYCPDIQQNPYKVKILTYNIANNSRFGIQKYEYSFKRKYVDKNVLITKVISVLSIRFWILLLLLFSPIDLIPDVFPIIGWIDDAVYLLFLYKSIVQIMQNIIMKRGEQIEIQIKEKQN